MKKVKTLIVLGSLGLLFLLVYGCTHEVVYTTVYPKKADAVQAIYLSQSGDVVLQTSDGWLRFSIVQQMNAYPFGPSSRRELKSDAPLPRWQDMHPGVPSREVLQGFEKIFLVRVTSKNFGKIPELVKSRVTDSWVGYENENYAYGEDFAWLRFELYSDRPLYSKFNNKSFSIELPSKLEWHIYPRKTKFMSVGG